MTKSVTHYAENGDCESQFSIMFIPINLQSTSNPHTLLRVMRAICQLGASTTRCLINQSIDQ